VACPDCHSFPLIVVGETFDAFAGDGDPQTVDAAVVLVVDVAFAVVVAVVALVVVSSF